MPPTPKKSSSSRRGEGTEKITPTSEVLVVKEGKLYVEKGVTKNMGDYNSARCTVGIELSFTEINYGATLKVANKLVDEEIEKQVTELMHS